jgi:dUTP pyrophosphatase
MLPSYSTAGSAAADLRSTDHHVIEPGERMLVMTGFKPAEMFGDVETCGFCALVVPRSGLAFKWGVTVLNAPGLIDPDYTGEVGVLLANFGHIDFEIKPGDRIAQLLQVPFGRYNGFAIESETRKGGFGSTGVE